MNTALAPAPALRSGFASAEDGVRLYWRAIGTGPAIVCCNGVGVSLFFWKYIVEHFSTTHTVVLWDYRCHGRSDRSSNLATADLSIPRHARDLARVLDVIGVEDALLLGHSMGCQVVFEFHRQFPERVRGMVPMLGSAGKTLETFYDFRWSPVLFKLASRWMDRNGDRAQLFLHPLLESPLAFDVARRLSLVDPYYCREEDLRPYIRHLVSLDLRVFLHAVLACQDHDCWPTLPEVRVPTLVVAAERDTFTPMWLSRKMAAAIPAAELLVLAEGSHAALIEQPETIQHRLERFIRERTVFPPAASAA